MSNYERWSESNIKTIRFRYLDNNSGKKVTAKCAAPEAVLEFANHIRKAGNAGLLDALLPSVPGQSSKCLIANAVNFESCVSGTGEPPFDDGSFHWGMFSNSVFKDDANQKIKELAEAAELDYGQASGIGYIKLPKMIGNAAWAFDCDAPEFRQFVKGDF